MHIVFVKEEDMDYLFESQKNDCKCSTISNVSMMLESFNKVFDNFDTEYKRIQYFTKNR